MSAVAIGIGVGLGGPPALNLNEIEMHFDAGNNTQTFQDTGSAASVWTASDSSVITSTAHIIAGVSSLQVGTTNSAYLSSPSSASNRLPPTANFSVKFKYYAASNMSAAGAGCYVLTLRDSGDTAAGTQFGIVTNGSGIFALVYSDGTTRSVFTTSTVMPVNADTSMEFNRSATTLNLLMNGSNIGQVTGFSGSFPAIPSTTLWRIGAAQGFNNGPSLGMYFDDFTLNY